MGKLIEGLWDCPYCGTKKIKGGLRECPSCGRPRDENTKFYMPNEIQYVSEEEESSIIRKPDWICSYCNSLNSDSDDICISCGSKRTDENLDYFSKEESSKLKETENKTGLNDNNSFKSNDKNFFKKNRKILFFIISTIILISGIICIFVPRTEIVTLDSFKWEREIGIEELRTVEESDWTLPENARLKSSNLEFSHYQSVLDHYEVKTRQVERQVISGYEEYVTGYRDLGNGYFEEVTAQRPIYETYYETEQYEEPVYRDEPVYLTKYYYEIDKWVYKRSIITQGEDKNPYWGELLLGQNERILSKTENYYIIALNKKEELKQFSVDYGMWCNLNVGQQVKVKKSIIGYGDIIEY